jgi:hypothetical protein
VSEPQVTAPQLLAAARAALAQTAALWGTSWSRAAAFLARQALETGVGQLWVGEQADLLSCSFFDQLLCLPAYLADDDTVSLARHTWCALSRACHAHPYELAPTLGEVQDLIDSVEEVVASVGK